MNRINDVIVVITSISVSPTSIYCSTRVKQIRIKTPLSMTVRELSHLGMLSPPLHDSTNQNRHVAGCLAALAIPARAVKVRLHLLQPQQHLLPAPLISCTTRPRSGGCRRHRDNPGSIGMCPCCDHTSRGLSTRQTRRRRLQPLSE